MKHKLELLASVIIACLLTGCASVAQKLLPETDPAIVRAEDVASRAQVSVDRFRKVQKAAPEEGNLDARHLERSLDEGFKSDVDTLKGLLKVYKKTHSPDARNALMVATERVKASGDVAHGQLSGPPLDRNRDTFAPPMPTPIEELRSEIRSVAALQSQQDAKLTRLELKLTQLLAIQRRLVNDTNTPTPPPLPPIPSRVP